MGSEKEAGRELDALVAEKVMGFAWRQSDSRGPLAYLVPSVYPQNWRANPAAERGHVDSFLVPQYSTDIAAAWLVVEKMRERRIGETEMQQVFRLAHCYTAEQVAGAICRAALAVAEAQPTPKNHSPASPSGVGRECE